MLVQPDYRGHRIQVDAVRVGARWDAEVRIHHVLSHEKRHGERVMCDKPDAELAERWGAAWARGWVDAHRAAPTSDAA